MNSVKSQTVILIPAYQPGEILTEIVRQLCVEFDVVVVDDGSGAEYRHIFDALDPKAHQLRHDENKGKGAALKTGIAYIRKRYAHHCIVTADADGQHRIRDIKKIAHHHRDHAGSLVLGSRTLTQEGVPLRSRIGNKLTSVLFLLVTQRRVRDTQTGLRAFDDTLTEMMQAVEGERFEYETNVLLKLSKSDVEIVEIPIATVYKNNNQGSHFNPIIDSWMIYREIFAFASSSLIAFVIDYVLFIVLVALTGSWGVATSVTFANIAARIVSASVNFSLNRRLVFGHKGSVVRSGAAYAALAIIVIVANTIVINILTSGIGISPYVAKIVTELLFFIVCYFVQKKFIFRLSDTIRR